MCAAELQKRIHRREPLADRYRCHRQRVSARTVASTPNVRAGCLVSRDRQLVCCCPYKVGQATWFEDDLDNVSSLDQKDDRVIGRRLADRLTELRMTPNRNILLFEPRRCGSGSDVQ